MIIFKIIKKNSQVPRVTGQSHSSDHMKMITQTPLSPCSTAALWDVAGEAKLPGVPKGGLWAAQTPRRASAPTYTTDGSCHLEPRHYIIKFWV